MFTVRGIGVDSYVKVDPDCPLTCDVVGEQAQFRFGSPRSTGLSLVLTEHGLERLIAAGTAALRAMHDPGIPR
jgi:hypothetical protein